MDMVDKLKLMKYWRKLLGQMCRQRKMIWADKKQYWKIRHYSYIIFLFRLLLFCTLVPAFLTLVVYILSNYILSVLMKTLKNYFVCRFLINDKGWWLLLLSLFKESNCISRTYEIFQFCFLKYAASMDFNF
jgi:hypothetical protein